MYQRRAKRQKAIENQVNRLGHRMTKLHVLSQRLSWYRLVIFLIGRALVFISFFWISENLAWLFAGTAFDYKLRPGPCPTTNALKIMRMEGLPVD